MIKISHKNMFYLLNIFITFVFIWLLQPVLTALFWSVVLVTIFYPLYKKIPIIKDKWQNLSALIAVIFCFMLGVFPVIGVSLLLVDDVNALISSLSSENMTVKKDIITSLESSEMVSKLLNRFDISLNDLINNVQRFFVRSADAIALTSLRVSEYSLNLMLNIGIMLYVMFFLFREGDIILHKITSHIPLSSQVKQTLVQTTHKLINATIKGNFIVAFCQGVLGGLFFWFAGISNALLWTVIMMIASLLPAIGSAIVWLPFAVFFCIFGDVILGISLIIYGVVVIGLSDNFLRPIFVGKEAQLPDYLIFLSTIGGLSIFGLQGFIIGPLITGLFIAVWKILGADYTDKDI